MFLAFSSGSGVAAAAAPIHNPGSSIARSHCRFCAQVKNYTDLLDVATDEEAKKQLITMLNFFKIDFVDLLNSEIPGTICRACYDEILKSYIFFLKVKVSQNILKQLYSKDNGRNYKIYIKSEPVDCVDTVVDSKYVEKEKLESNTNIDHHSYSLPSTYNVETRNSEAEQKLCVPIQAQTAHEIKKNNNSNQNEKLESNTNIDHHSYSLPSLSNVETRNSKLEQKLCVPIQAQTAHEIKINNNSNPTKLECKQNITSLHTKVPHFVNKVPHSVNKVPHSENSSTVINNVVNTQKDLTNMENVSWTNYPWTCKHCQLKFHTMLELRNHSMQLHERCFGYQCADCLENYNTFYLFIEHVRRHRDALRLYCPHCNKQFSTAADCIMHELAYWSNGQKICNWCGEICPNADAVNAHKSKSRRVTLPKKETNKVPQVVSFLNQHELTWKHYEWGCLECALSFKSVAELRAHSQSVHDKCFAMRCADCLAVKYAYPHFVSHVTAHRPYLRFYCPYCDQQFQNSNEVKNHTKEHLTGAQRACFGCGQIFQSKEEETQHMDRFNPRRTHENMTTEDLTCHVCQKVFCNTTALRSHKRLHDEVRKKDQCCHLCGKQFLNKKGLQSHMLCHNDKKFYCKVCHKRFACEAYLKVHVMSHTKPFVCDYCSKGFTRKIQLESHMNSIHKKSEVIRKYECTYCSKRFKYLQQLKTHINVHTGATPYKCQDCERTFANWGNCNTHMINVHGTTLAKNKLTERGKVPIGEEMPEITTNVQEWMAEVTKAKKVRKN